MNASAHFKHLSLMKPMLHDMCIMFVSGKRKTRSILLSAHVEYLRENCITVVCRDLLGKILEA